MQDKKNKASAIPCAGHLTERLSGRYYTHWVQQEQIVNCLVFLSPNKWHLNRRVLDLMRRSAGRNNQGESFVLF